MRPFRPRETKEYGPRADVQTPVLQYLVAALILTLDGLLVLSWIVLAPPVAVWLLGMVVVTVTPPLAWYMGSGWVLVNLCGIDADDTNVIVGHVLSTLFALVFTWVFVYHVFWDWWEAICYGGFFGIPTPHIVISPLLGGGVLLFLLGAVFILWKPSGYTFTLQAIGALASAASWYYQAPSLHWTKGASTSLSNADLVFYGIWIAVSIGVLVPSKFLLDRMFTEMEDDFPYEHAPPLPPQVVTQREVSMVPIERYPIAPTKPTIVHTHDGTKGTTVRMDELVEFLYHAERKGTFSRTKLFPYKFECSGRKATQYNHWMELISPLEVVKIYSREDREIAPEYVKGDGTLDVPKALARTGWNGH